MLRVDIITIFPEIFNATKYSILGRAIETKKIQCNIYNLRDQATGVHKTVDDAPYAGGAGMVMKASVWGAAIDCVIEKGAKELKSEPTIIIPTPSGPKFDQDYAQKLANTSSWLIFLCGRYEGIDERVFLYYSKMYKVLKLSIGDYVINGGEVASLVILEAITRLKDGVLGNPHSLDFESHNTKGVLEYPVYTRPEEWRGLKVPPVLLSGNHKAIQEWKTKNQRFQE